MFRKKGKFILISLVSLGIWVILPGIERFLSSTNNPENSNVKHQRLVKSTNLQSIEHDVKNMVRLKDDYSSQYHIYNDSVDLRIIVLTFNRAQSLQKTLNSLQDFVTDGHRVSLEIWIDKPKHSPRVDHKTLQVAENFRWTNGKVNVWIHTRHVGLIGQWLYTWRAGLTTGGAEQRELALFIEDDIDISKYGYRWLRAVRRKYSSRNDVACYTLQNDNAIGSYGRYRRKEIKKPTNSPVFFHRLPGSWAMSPDPGKWRQFQDWFEEKRADSAFHPYVKKAAIQTEWYKTFEKQGRQDSMWTMWYIYYTSERNQICGYANLPAYTKRNDTSLASNRREPGLHYNAAMQRRHKALPLLKSWNEDYINFIDNPPIFDFGGELFQVKRK